ncbi:MAG TPA: flagellar basal body P-ring formation chaperone FlgA [Beijerinckiaceae bacterium]|jgi:flagella basal body P-ring formation protein FlgA
MVRLALAALVCVAALQARAAERTLVVPTVTLYPRDVIRADQLETRAFVYDPDGPSAYAESADAIVGLVARSTLVANRPIPLNGVEKAKIVANGAQVRMRFNQGGFTIVTAGQALQAGGLGEMVRVRNADTGLVVSGLVREDGAVEVGDQ